MIVLSLNEKKRELTAPFFFSFFSRLRPHLGGHTQGIWPYSFFVSRAKNISIKKQPTHIISNNQRRTTNNNKNNFFNLGTALLLFATWEVESEEDKEEDKDDG